MLRNFNLLLDGIHDDLSEVVNAEHITALRCALVDFLEDIQQLNDDVNKTQLYVSKKDREYIRHIIKQAGELYLSIR